MTRVYLLRHGETAWNATGNRYCGRTDLPLSSHGHAQAGAASHALAAVQFDVVYVSPLRRSRETGELIASARSLPITSDPRLTEIDFGAWEGLTAAEITLADPNGRAAWLKDPTSVRAGGTGETGQEVSQRVQGVLSEIATTFPGSSVAVVGHNTANRLYLAASLGAPLASYRRITLENASISVLELDSREARWLRINDVSHLRN
jgi:alpha-ribazole phosphatase/probable phosphoglycerate mutase